MHSPRRGGETATTISVLAGSLLSIMRFWTYFHIPVLFICFGIDSTRGITNSIEASGVQNPAKAHLVNIIYENDIKEVYFLCYGVKFQPYYFLTTASCFDRFRNSGKLSIMENTVRVSSVQRPNGPSVFAVGVLEHPKYTIMKDQSSKSERRYNLAILRVAENLDEITTAAELPDATPQYGATFCSLMVFKDKMNPDELVDIKGNVLPTEDCVSNKKPDSLTIAHKSYSFCVQIQRNPKIKEEYISGAPVTCNDTGTIFGVFSWGYEPNEEINYLLVTSFASQSEWIREHQEEKFPLPGATRTTSENPGTSKPTPDPGHSNGPTQYPDNTTQYPDEVEDDSSAGHLPFNLPIVLFIVLMILLLILLCIILFMCFNRYYK